MKEKNIMKKNLLKLLFVVFQCCDDYNYFANTQLVHFGETSNIEKF